MAVSLGLNLSVMTQDLRRCYNSRKMEILSEMDENGMRRGSNSCHYLMFVKIFSTKTIIYSLKYLQKENRILLNVCLDLNR